MSLTYALTSKRLLGGVVGFSGHLFDSFPLVNKGTSLAIQEKCPFWHITEDTMTC